MSFGLLYRVLSGCVILSAVSIASAQTEVQPAPTVPVQPPVPNITNTPVPASKDVSVPSADMTIGVGDLLKVSVMGAPEYDQDVRVSGNGDIVLAMAGKVHVAGDTTDQAQQAIRKRLMDGKYFTDPQVSVFEKEFATQGVSVLGEVQRPGVYPMTGPRRLFDVLSLAGGTSARAGQVVTISSRDSSKGIRSVKLSSDPEKNMQANVDISPGDTVVVSRAGVVYVVGDVKRPMGVLMDNTGQITILQALATAEGANPTAALGKTKIVRRTESGPPTEVMVDLKKIMQAKAPDVNLRAEDVVFVPTSTPKNVGERTLQSIVGIATGVVTYRAIY